jgi:hypothetical protein
VRGPSLPVLGVPPEVGGSLFDGDGLLRAHAKRREATGVCRFSAPDGLYRCANILDRALEPLGAFTLGARQSESTHIFEDRVDLMVLEGTVVTDCRFDEPQIPLRLRGVDQPLGNPVVDICKRRVADLERADALTILPNLARVLRGRIGVDLGDRRLVKVIRRSQEAISLITSWMNSRSTSSSS